MNQPLAIVGASTRAASASAQRAGFQPLAADLFADADLRAIATTTRISPYPDGFLDWMRALEPPAWMYTGALENHPELVDQLAWIAPLWGNPCDVLERVRSPWELSAAIRDAGLLFPETRAAADGLPQDGSWLAKSYRGASGSGVREWGEQKGREGKGERGRHDVLIEAATSPPLCYQRRIPGIPAAAVFVAANNTATLLGITRQLIGEPWLGARGFQYAGSLGPLPVDDSTRAAIQHIGNTLAESFELIGLFGVDMILNHSGPWTIEVNPRYTASVEICERATGANALALHASAFNGSATNPERAGRSSAPKVAIGKAILFAKRDLQISEMFAEISLAAALRTPWPTLADVSPAGAIIEAGRPILSLFANGDTIEIVEHRLRLRVQQLEPILYGGDPP